MGFTAVTADFAWQAASLLNEYTSAQRDREIVTTGSATTAAVSAGDDIQTAAGVIGILQTASVGLRAQGWLDPTPANYNDEADLPANIASDAALLTVAGIPDGFRRCTDYGDLMDWEDYDDAGYAHGAIQAGDIIGPWLFVDLQAVYAVLTRQEMSADKDGLSGYYQGLDVSAVGWSTAKAGAEADWGHTAGATDVYAYSWGQNAGSGFYNAKLNRSWTQFTARKSPVGISRTVTWYLKPVVPDVVEASDDPTFDDHGDEREDGDPIVVDVLNACLVEEYAGAGGGGTWTSTGHIGSVAASTKPITPWCGTPTTTISRGWYGQAEDLAATVDWNFDDQP